ncbi:MAG: tRNA (adenosine(37)-N6)-dimethylallyltransferase MiaA [Anaerolineae bacterium]|jgi:tRNA dimethylallyltransferase|nr:tRNA (adenosine(37)-N6)-dimethylallyltransferase MiaA [Anaerolineae bacterium]
MFPAEIQNPLVILVGPTAVGKTELSLALAETLNGEIISSDSRLFYRGMNIGTAKPSPAEMARVRHHLVDVTEPNESWSLAVFQQEAYTAIEDIHKRGKLPIMVGGTGQYVHAIVNGWVTPEQAPDDGLREVLDHWSEEIGKEALHQKLAMLDPEAAKKIDYRNVRRTIRALEVIFHTGERFSSQRRKGKPRYPTLQIGLYRPREEIFQRVDERIEQMFAIGFVEEVRGLLAAGFKADDPGMASIGYREVIAYLNGEMTLIEVKARMRQLTHAFVRRQANWFKAGDPNIHWFDVRKNGILKDIVAEILNPEHWPSTIETTPNTPLPSHNT